MTTTTATHVTRGLTALVSDVGRAVRGAAPGQATVDAVAVALRPATSTASPTPARTSRSHCTCTEPT